MLAPRCSDADEETPEKARSDVIHHGPRAIPPWLSVNMRFAVAPSRSRDTAGAQGARFLLPEIQTAAPPQSPTRKRCDVSKTS